MGYWNYRFVKIENENPWDDDDKYSYELCEVFYNDDGKPWGYCDASIVADNPEERFEIACWISAAAAKDILDAKDILAEPDFDEDILDCITLEDLLKEIREE